MDLNVFLWLLTSLIAAFLRGFQTLLATELGSPEIGTLVRMLPVLVIPFAAFRQFQRRRLPYGLSLLLIEVYFIFNRLTVFALKPLSLGELLGNIGLIWLGVLLLRPERPRKERKPHA
jgi:hypothetical protein